MPAIILCILLIDAGLSVAFLLNYLIGGPSGFVTHQINLNGEANLTAWYSSAKLLGVALLLALTSHRRFLEGDSRWIIVAAVSLAFLMLSADETAQVHEWLGQRTDAFLPDGTREGTVFGYTGIWMFVLGVPFAIALFGALYWLKGVFAIAPGSLALFAAGAGLLLLGALGVEFTQNMAEPDSLGMILSILAEEFLEMVGVTVMLWAAYNLELQTRASSSVVRGGRASTDVDRVPAGRRRA
jgi:hypothetical protein